MVTRDHVLLTMSAVTMAESLTRSDRLTPATASDRAFVALLIEYTGESAIISKTAIRSAEACNRVLIADARDFTARIGSQLLKVVTTRPSSVFATAALFSSMSIAL